MKNDDTQYFGRVWAVMGGFLTVVFLAFFLSSGYPGHLPWTLIGLGCTASGVYAARAGKNARLILVLAYIAAFGAAVIIAHAVTIGANWTLGGVDAIWAFIAAVWLMFSITVLWWHVERRSVRSGR